jgi:hypothetical protein
MRLLVVLLGALSAIGLPPIAAQHADMAPAVPTELERPMPLVRNALGKFHRPVSTSVKEAQAYVDQGFQLMFAFDKMDAIRSFREAEKLDPSCVMCFWGEAWSWGSYLNGVMDTNDAPHAYAAVRQAMTIAANRGTPVERELVHALSVRYVEHFNPATRRDQDEAYAGAMGQVHERFPRDLDVATLYGEALFLLEPRRGSRDIDAPNVRRIAQVLESVLARDVRHVGACHLYVHLTEATVSPGKAEACAEFLGNAIPGASHINHMPSHTWNGVGRWGDSVRANLQAWRSDQRAASGEAFAIYPTHNLHMLAFAASMDGQSSVAIQAAKDYEAMTHSPFLRVLTLVRFGRYGDVDNIFKPTSDPIDEGVWNFGEGYARLKQGGPDQARVFLDRVLDSAEHSKAVFRFHSAHDLLGTLGAILEGEIARATGDRDRAIASFERAVALNDAMIYDEPEPLPFAARHWLGAALVEANRHAEAERVFRDDLARHPKNGWSLIGLRAALEGQGKPARDVAKQFTSSWKRADLSIRASRF